MEEDYKKWYTINSPVLGVSTINVDTFLHCLTAKGLADDSLLNIVGTKRNDPEKCFTIYNHLVKLGFQKIVDIEACLKESHNEKVALEFQTFRVMWLLHHRIILGPPEVLIDKSSTWTQSASRSLSLDHNALLRYCGLIIADYEALNKWPRTVEHTVKLSTDRMLIHVLLKKHDYHEAVLETLRVWAAYEIGRPDLLQILENEGLGKIADQIRESN